MEIKCFILFKGKDFRIVFYTKLVEIVRLYSFLFYIIIPCRFLLEVVDDVKIFNIILLLVLSIFGFLGVMASSSEGVDFTNNCYSNDYHKACLIPIFAPSFYVALISLPKPWELASFFDFLPFNFDSDFYIYAGIGIWLISFFTLCVTNNKELKDRIITAIAITVLILGIIFLFTLSIMLFPFVLAGALTLIFYGLMQNYPASPLVESHRI